MTSTYCLVATPPESLELRHCSLRRPSKEMLLLETLYSGVSPGTELRCLRGDQPGLGARPFVPGYQAVAQVIDSPADSGFKAGDLVFRSNGGGFGEGIASSWGAHAKRAWCTPAHVVPLPEGTEPLAFAIAKMGAIAWHGIVGARLREGERVAVIGLGLLGQLSARLARAQGARVVAFDRVLSRVEVARSDGIDARGVRTTLADASREAPDFEKGFDVLIDVTGNASLLSEVIALARELLPWEQPLGEPTRCIVQGSYGGDLSLDYEQAFMKELSMQFPRDHTRADLEAVIAQIGAGDLRLDNLLSAPVSPEQAATVYGELMDPHSGRMSAIFDWRSV